MFHCSIEKSKYLFDKPNLKKIVDAYNFDTFSLVSTFKKKIVWYTIITI